MIVLTNTTDSEIIVHGNLFRESGQDNDSKEISPLEQVSWSNDSAVLSYIADGSLVLSLNSVDQTDINTAINILKGITAKVSATNYPFASKNLPDGKKLFRRVHGLSAAVTSTQSSHKFTVPYTLCKITGIEVVSSEAGDFVDFHILDTATGAVTGVANYSLNQFGFSTYLAAGYHRDISNYDADLFAGLQIEIKYTSISSKTVYINLILHEVKD